MNELHNINKQSIHNKLSKVHTITKDVELYNCGDIIEILSKNKLSDMRYLNGYLPDEVVVILSTINKKTRKRRFFTLKGLTRYIRFHNIISYKHVCEYFNIEYIDKKIIEYKMELDNMTNIVNDVKSYNTKKLIYWLTGVKVKDVPEYIQAEDVSDYVADCYEDKLKYFNDIAL
jgi:hypothetical protein